MTKKDFYLNACVAFAKVFAGPYSSDQECVDNDVQKEACYAAQLLTTYAELIWKDWNGDKSVPWNEPDESDHEETDMDVRHYSCD